MLPGATVGVPEPPDAALTMTMITTTTATTAATVRPAAAATWSRAHPTNPPVRLASAIPCTVPTAGDGRRHARRAGVAHSRGMAEPIAVDDPRDARLADYVGLTDAALRRRVEHGRGLFIAEGELVIRQLLVSPYPVRSVLVAPTRYAHLRDVLDGLDAPVYVAPKEVLEAV